MAETTTPPSPSPSIPPDRIDQPPSDKPPTSVLIAVSSGLAWFAVLLFVGSAAMFAFPVDNPGVQHCGAPAMFLVHGTEDALLYDPQGNPINHYSQKQLQNAYNHRCSKAVANQAVPAAELGVGFVLVSLLALILALAGHRSARIADLGAWSAEASLR